MDYKGALGRFAACQLDLATIAKKDPFLGLPCFIFYSRVFQLILRIWCGCYGAAGAFGISEIECDFLYRWFLGGGVIDNDEFQATLSIAIRFCSQAIIPQTGWAALDEFFKLATQHSRIEQPWGQNCILWIHGHRLQ
jgi:hypothetical protein